MARYDIFISYRNNTGAQYSRTLQLLLEKKGYKVFLDYDELKDNEFKPQIEEAIKNTTVFIIVLTPGSLNRCVNKEDWVRRELEKALEFEKKIVPINPDGLFDGIPDEVPSHIKNTIEGIQHSNVDFGQNLKVTFDRMVKNRIRPIVRPYAKFKWGALIVGLLALFIFLGLWQLKKDQISEIDIEQLKPYITFNDNNIDWPEHISKERLSAVIEILDNMELIEGGEFMQGAAPLNDGSYHKNVEIEFETPAHKQSVNSFYLSKFEVTVAQWNAVMQDNREGEANNPISSISFDQAQAFCDSLFNLTNIEFRLPTETEWEFAAKGGNKAEGFMFAGSNNPDEVAWYAENSNGKPHSDLRGTPTINDIFNLSGNVSEWCDSEFAPYNPEIPVSESKTMVIRGGNYDSKEYELTTTHREPMLPEISIPTLGFRLAISN